MTRRLFFAITLPGEVRESVARIQSQLRATMGGQGIGWDAPDKFHYTLKFLGEVTGEEKALALEAARVVAQQFAPFSLTVAGVGTFPEQRRPQVLWLGATGDIPVLNRLAECLDRELSSRGFARESRRYRPHITLARMKSEEAQETVAKTLKIEVADLKNVDTIGVFRVESFVLIESELQPSGSVYTLLETFPLTTF